MGERWGGGNESFFRERPGTIPFGEREDKYGGQTKAEFEEADERLAKQLEEIRAGKRKGR